MFEPSFDTVYVVDDDPSVVDSLCCLVTAVGLRAHGFESGEEFLSTFEPDAACCLVTDLAMPGMSGLELARTMAAKHCSVPVVIITGHGDIPVAVDAMKAGVFDFIEKPFEADAIIGVVTAALEESRRRGRHGETRTRLANLGDREREVLELILEGLPTKAIAGRLGSSFNTVRNQRSQILRKMKAGSTAELVRIVTQAELQPAAPTQ